MNVGIQRLGNEAVGIDLTAHEGVGSVVTEIYDLNDGMLLPEFCTNGIKPAGCPSMGITRYSLFRSSSVNAFALARRCLFDTAQQMGLLPSSSRLNRSAWLAVQYIPS